MSVPGPENAPAALRTRVAVITGGSLGIGASIAQQLLDEGWTIHVIARHASTCMMVGEPNCHVYDVDVRDLAAIEVAASTIGKRTGSAGVDALILCAGVGYPTPLSDVSFEQYDDLFRTNVAGTIFCVRAFERLLRDGESVIVIMSSIAGRRGFADWSLYCAAKHALEGFAASIRHDLRGRRIRVTSIQPGSVDTPSYDHIPPEEKAEFIAPDVVAALTVHALMLPSTATVETLFVNNTVGDL